VHKTCSLGKITSSILGLLLQLVKMQREDETSVKLGNALVEQVREERFHRMVLVGM
jgi:hypothetical protein